MTCKETSVETNGPSADDFIQIEASPCSKSDSDHQIRHSHRSCCCHCSRGTRLAAVATTIIAVILVAATITAVVFYLYNSRAFFADKRSIIHTASSDVEQETHIDSSHKYVTYSIHTKGPSFPKTEVMIDTNKALQIYKITTNNKVVCYLTPIVLTPSASDSTSIPSNLTNVNLTQINAQITFKASSIPIQDTQILGDNGKKFCNTKYIYWSLLSNDPAANQSSNSANTEQNSPERPLHTSRLRVKRQIRLIYVCFWDWNSCRYFTFPDDVFGFRYYSCRITCRYINYNQYYGPSK